VDWIHLAYDKVWWQPLLIMEVSMLVPQKTENFLFGWVIVSFWRRTLLHGWVTFQNI